jgi:hypothetical protein
MTEASEAALGWVASFAHAACDNANKQAKPAAECCAFDPVEAKRVSIALV